MFDGCGINIISFNSQCRTACISFPTITHFNKYFCVMNAVNVFVFSIHDVYNNQFNMTTVTDGNILCAAFFHDNGNMPKIIRSKGPKIHATLDVSMMPSNPDKVEQS